jgi:HYR domain-containing protein
MGSGPGTEQILGGGTVLNVTLPLGEHAIGLRVTDSEGATDGAEILIDVQDGTPPVLTCPPAAMEECAGPEGAQVVLIAAASDACGGVTLKSSRAGGPDASGTYPLGSTAVTFTATDASGNVATCSAPVTVKDTTPPALVVPAGFSVDATTPAGAVLTYSTSATDVCAGAVTPVCAPASGGTFPMNPPGTFTTVHCDAADPQGNRATGSFPVHVAGAVEQIENLDRLVVSLRLPRSLDPHLRGDLREALETIGQGEPREGCDPMSEFIDTVRSASASRKPRIAAEQARALLEAAARIRAVLGCQEQRGPFSGRPSPGARPSPPIWR